MKPPPSFAGTFTACFDALSLWNSSSEMLIAPTNIESASIPVPNLPVHPLSSISRHLASTSGVTGPLYGDGRPNEPRKRTD